MTKTLDVSRTIPTQEEMLAAPADDYMSPRQLAFFRDLLRKERDALLAAAKDTTLHLQENEATPDPSDRATMEEDHTLELRVRDRERKLLHKIDEALDRIEGGNFGWCEETGEPIGIARLIARPTATYSVEAQERYEKRRKMRGG
ncbi:RNA polymerase-binding protein DksA [Niveibacterium sp. 24ML]|uniref:RNA polymerase-binding protein DksA n=1 Tax=Niveibacterium sp. 24ML TaxID=2985512 RepID=UPI00226F437C|nr:RNA polymerase-binding protein DksA [Niveibacterium sp. 24ML]MCX9156412.1 RNA polymerase-binding protein DksA [Niveibacterium sp. 24ML]